MLAVMLRDLHAWMRKNRGRQVAPPALATPIARVRRLPLFGSAKDILHELGPGRLKDALVEVTGGRLSVGRLATRLPLLANQEAGGAMLLVSRLHDGSFFRIVSAKDRWSAPWPSCTLREARYMSEGSVVAAGGWWKLMEAEQKLFSPAERKRWARTPKPAVIEETEVVGDVSPEMDILLDEQLWED